MKPDINACRTMCVLSHVCHPELRPETINIAGQTRPVTEKHHYVNGTMCRHYTCWSGGGEQAARNAAQGEPERFTVIERSGRRQAIMGWAFGTQEKPTAKEKLRIVSQSGSVYSFQDDAYFATGQTIQLDRGGRPERGTDTVFK